MKALSKIFLVLATGLLFYSNASTQEPTLQETMESIKGKIENNNCVLGGRPYFHNTSYGDPFPKHVTVSFICDKCEATIEVHEFYESRRNNGKGKEYLDWSRKETFSFSDFDPLNITSGYDQGYYISLGTTSKKKSVKSLTRWKYTYEGKVDKSERSEDNYNEQMFSRVLFLEPHLNVSSESWDSLEKATKHAIKLCGGKVAPF